MVNSYYGIYQAERGKTAAEIRAADAQVGGLAAELVSSARRSPPRPARYAGRCADSGRPRPAAPDAG